MNSVNIYSAVDGQLLINDTKLVKDSTGSQSVESTLYANGLALRRDAIEIRDIRDAFEVKVNGKYAYLFMLID